MEGVGIGVIIVMDLVELMEEIHKEIMSQKLVINVTEMATEDVMFVMEQEKEWNTNPLHFTVLSEGFLKSFKKGDYFIICSL